MVNRSSRSCQRDSSIAATMPTLRFRVLWSLKHPWVAAEISQSPGSEPKFRQMTCMELLGDSSKSSLTLYSKTALLLVEGMPWYKAGPRSSSLNDPKISIGSRGCFRAEDSQQLKAMAQVGVTVSLEKFAKDSEVFSTASPDASVETLRTALEEDYEVKKVLGQGKFGLVQEVVKKAPSIDLR